jgi:hypothetical protein
VFAVGFVQFAEVKEIIMMMNVVMNVVCVVKGDVV